VRVTFVQPLQGTKFGFTKILRVEPLGMECVSSTLKLHDHETYYVDLRLDKPRVLENHLRDWKPHAVGIACGFSTDVYTALEGARQIKDVLPDTIIFTGGHHSSLVPGDLLFPGSPIDAVVVGEGEWPTLDLIDAMERGDEPSAVPGIMTLENLGNGFVSREIMAGMDDLPLPDRELSKRYRHLYHHGFRSPSACVETTRGCPFNCNFCSIWVFYQRRARRFSAERIVADLEHVRRLGERDVFFTDDIAFLQRESYEELADAIEAAGLTDMSFSCETRADLVMKYPETFKRWKEIGLHMVFLGIEKMDDDGLDSVRKRTKGGALTNLAAIEYLEDCEISPLASLIADPGWDDEDFDRLEETVKLHKLTNPGFTVLTPLPGTELWETVKDKITTDDYAYFDVMHLVLPSKLPPVGGGQEARADGASGENLRHAAGVQRRSGHAKRVRLPRLSGLYPEAGLGAGGVRAGRLGGPREVTPRRIGRRGGRDRDQGRGRLERQAPALLRPSTAEGSGGLGLSHRIVVHRNPTSKLEVSK
jgi:radical SAM superfamily enzyme YgiQ (UPF0313 family)